ncbi:hydantoinase/oxoprolinase family protein [Pseudogemmobacter humi]|uniref:Acetophenone carboxylase gamma subunit n=1 Tax=Pseudogemmobacter humi TaxID=2483812 RepID=A0A3P5WL08_9RHOB|nr:hydantoinase/oxoprolinase family protein [Pseudogemmobacter humi]VDC22358.1 Acetophenone carboxylase gamma subunit [Pseudogemmobacter humi]
MKYRISVDVGGTFTDLTIAESETFTQLGSHKSPTTPEDRSVGILNAMTLAAEGLNLTLQELLSQTAVFCHGSTTATNTIIEMSGAKTGLICTRGTKYILWRGEGRRQTMFNYKMEPNKPLIRPYLCREVTERIDAQGNILVPLNEDEVRAEVRQLREWGVEAIAVCTMWSIVNDKHERRIAEIIEEEWPGVDYCISSDIQPIIREYYRTSCVVLNAMLQPKVSRYLRNLQGKLEERGFRGETLIVVSNGGVVPISEVAKKPVFMLFSGPSMAPEAGYYFSEIEGIPNCITVDMGGTSFDVSTVLEGQVTTTKDGRILNYPTGVASIEIATLGAGGGSIATIDKGLIKVGPRSAEAVPGPACYMRGGTEPTVTDAYVVLGYISPEHFLNGRMKIDRDLAVKAVKEHIADPLGISVEDAALGITQVVNENMLGGILDMTIRRGVDPREFALVTGGGATAVPVAFLAREMGIRKIVIPRETSVLCAFGANNAAIAMSEVVSKYSDTGNFDYEGVNAAVAGITGKGSEFLTRMGIAPRDQKFELFVSARYPMQTTELEIPITLDDGKITPAKLDEITEAFHAAYLARYKTNDPASDVEFLMWRNMATFQRPKIVLAERAKSTEATPLSAMLSTSKAYFGGGEAVDMPIYDGDRLQYGMSVPGPALVVLPDTTIVVPPFATLNMRKHGYFVMDVDVDTQQTNARSRKRALAAAG